LTLAAVSDTAAYDGTEYCTQQWR